MVRSRIRSFIYKAWLHASGRSEELAFHRFLRSRQFDSAQEVGAQQRSCLTRLLQFAVEHVPYYRAEFAKASINASDVAARPFEALAALPLLDKSTLRARFDDLKADDLSGRKWSINMTGGSTGEPVRFVQDATYQQKHMAAKRLFDEWSGHSLGAPKVLLWGSERDLLVGKESWRSRMGAALRGEWSLNAFRMTEADLDRFVRIINEVRPVQLLAYVDAASELARFVERNQLEIHSPTAVMTSAGALDSPTRSLIESVFRAPVFNRYGSREVGDVACECNRHQGLHVNPLTHYLEVLRPDGSPCNAGEIGEFAVTLLTNEAMPLIRYRIGDVGAWSEKSCDCGRNWRMLETVAGRVGAVVRTRKGAFTSTAMTTLMYYTDVEKTKPVTSIARYQLIQQAIDRLVLNVVVRDQARWQEERDLIVGKLRATLGSDLQIDVHVLDDIPPSPSGKYQFIWSEVA